jgi:hypothetical protein
MKILGIAKKLLGIGKALLGNPVVKWAVAVIVIVLGAYKIHQKWAGVSTSLGQIGLLSSFEALLALLVAQYASLKVWQVILDGLGSPLRTRVAGRILLVGQLGKYIPGSLWPILTQMELGAQAKVPRPRSASASALTMLMSLVVGLVIAVVTIPFAAVRSNDYLWVFLLLPFALAFFHPRVLNPLLNWLFKLTKRAPLEAPISGRTIAVATAWQVMAWAFQCLQIWILAEKFGTPMGRLVLIALGGWAFAWCVGFVIILAPAGGGPRDYLLWVALKPVIGSGPATAVMLASRGITIISDLLCAGVAAFRRPRFTVPETAAGLATPATVPLDQPEGEA